MWAFFGKIGLPRVAFFGVVKHFLFWKPDPNLTLRAACMSVHCWFIGSGLFSPKLIFPGLPFMGCPLWKHVLGCAPGCSGDSSGDFQGSPRVFPAIKREFFAREHRAFRELWYILEGLGSRTPTLLVDIVGMGMYVYGYGVCGLGGRSPR